MSIRISQKTQMGIPVQSFNSRLMTKFTAFPRSQCRTSCETYTKSSAHVGTIAGPNQTLYPGGHVCLRGIVEGLGEISLTRD